MDTYASDLKKQLWELIAQITQNRKLCLRNPGKDFTRKRKLPVDTLIKFMLQLQNKSLPNELGVYFHHDPNMPTPSAYIQQRSKLSDRALLTLFSKFVSLHKPWSTPDDFRLISCDGSDICYAGNAEDINNYFRTKDGKSYCLAHLNALLDTLSGVFIDAIIQDRRSVNEIEAMLEMIKRADLGPNAVFIADRGYENYKLLAHIRENNQYFLFRVKSIDSNGILSLIKKLPRNAEFDINTVISLTKRRNKQVMQLKQADPGRYRILKNDNCFDLSGLNARLFYDLPVRITCIRLADNSYEYLLSNLPMESFPPERLKEIYHMRWGIETAFRQLKYIVALCCIHTKKAKYVGYEIYARLILFNFCKMVVLHASIFKKSSDGKRTYKINFSTAVGACRELLSFPSDAPPCDYIAYIRRFLTSSAHNMHYPRNLSPRKPVSFFYRNA